VSLIITQVVQKGINLQQNKFPPIIFEECRLLNHNIYNLDCFDVLDKFFLNCSVFDKGKLLFFRFYLHHISFELRGLSSNGYWLHRIVIRYSCSWHEAAAVVSILELQCRNLKLSDKRFMVSNNNFKMVMWVFFI
jgi:hypothetical protein